MGFRSTLDSIDEIGNLREEGVVILFISIRQEKKEVTCGERVPLLVIISRSSISSDTSWVLEKDIPDVESGLLVWVHQSHVVSIGPNL